MISDTRTIAGKELREILSTATGRGEARRQLPLENDFPRAADHYSISLPAGPRSFCSASAKVRS